MKSFSVSVIMDANGGVAQRLEQRAHNLLVAGSIPATPTIVLFPPKNFKCDDVDYDKPGTDNCKFISKIGQCFTLRDNQP